MSVVLGIETPKFVLIASDSQATTANGILMSSGKLIAVGPHAVVGLVGTLHWQKWAMNDLSESQPEYGADEDAPRPIGLSAHRSADFRWLLDNMPEDVGGDEHCAAMAATAHGVYLIDGAGVVPVMPHDYDGRIKTPVAMAAIGSGADFVLGSVLAHLAILSQVETDYDDPTFLVNAVSNALSTAYRFDPSCSGPINFRLFTKSPDLAVGSDPFSDDGADDTFSDEEDEEDDDTDEEDVH
jgi:hypothetical protein